MGIALAGGSGGGDGEASCRTSDDPDRCSGGPGRSVELTRDRRLRRPARSGALRRKERKRGRSGAMLG
jgi:hypothetical protein